MLLPCATLWSKALLHILWRYSHANLSTSPSTLRIVYFRLSAFFLRLHTPSRAWRLVIDSSEGPIPPFRTIQTDSLRATSVKVPCVLGFRDHLRHNERRRLDNTVQVDGTIKLLIVCLLGSSVTHCCVAHERFGFSCVCDLHNTASPCCSCCPATRGIGSTPQHRGTPNDGHHPRTNTRPRKAAIMAGASGVLAEIQASMNADAATETMVKHRIL